MKKRERKTAEEEYIEEEGLGYLNTLVSRTKHVIQTHLLILLDTATF